MNGTKGRICVLGLGYIGLPTASLLATEGFDVHGVDRNETVVETINRGAIHITEPDLDILVRAAVQGGRLHAAPEPAPADVFIIAVPTPFREGHVPDVSMVEAATHALAPHLAPGNLVILESTSPVGTSEAIAGWLAADRPDLAVAGRGDSDPEDEGAVHVAHCPERVLPGQILRELVENDRIIGGLTPASAARAEAFYGSVVKGAILLTDCRTAEMCKLVENAYRDVNIAFANELSMICDRLGVNAWELIRLANHHPRVNILSPGPGVGGHCIAVDPWFLIHAAPDESPLLRTAREVNNGKTRWVLEQARALAAGTDGAVACLGLAYKANVDDLRESPAVAVTRALAETLGPRVLAVEPHIRELPSPLTQAGVRLATLEEALAEASVLLLLVDHKVFREVEPATLATKRILDTRGIWTAGP